MSLLESRQAAIIRWEEEDRKQVLAPNLFHRSADDLLAGRHARSHYGEDIGGKFIKLVISVDRIIRGGLLGVFTISIKLVNLLGRAGRWKVQRRQFRRWIIMVVMGV
jgi:hypothetical protein